MAHVIVVGAGAIGSQVLPHVARMFGVTAVTVVDRDRYESSNLATQNISTHDVGKSKAQTQAIRLKQINRSLESKAVHMPVEDLPLGWLRADAILACLDSRRARMTVNQAAWRLGVPWINAGIDASGLARVQVFLPADDAPCLECAWDERDYALVEERYPCQAGTASSRSGAASEIGGLAAALQAVECRKLLGGHREHLLAGRDLLIDVQHHMHYVTRFDRNPSCRMPDHTGWTIAASDIDPSSTTLDQLIAISDTLPGAGAGVRLAVAGQQFVTMLTCPSCGGRVPLARVYRGEFRRNPPLCQNCGAERVAAGFDFRDAVPIADFPEAARGLALTELGLLFGDVLTLTTAETETRLEMRGPAWPIEF